MGKVLELGQDPIGLISWRLFSLVSGQFLVPLQTYLPCTGNKMGVLFCSVGKLVDLITDHMKKMRIYKKVSSVIGNGAYSQDRIAAYAMFVVVSF